MYLKLELCQVMIYTHQTVVKIYKKYQKDRSEYAKMTLTALVVQDKNGEPIIYYIHV
jgi:hypothetical protein